MRIRKRTPARAASPVPPSPPSPPPLPLQQPKEKPRGEEEEEDKAAAAEQEEEKRVGDGGGDDDRVRPAAVAASGNRNSTTRGSATDDEPEPEPQDDASAGGVRCSRNDGKRWRCKKAAVPGYLFCDRHIAWSTRKRKPRATNSKPKSHGSGVPKPTTVTIVPKEIAEEDHGDTQQQRNAGFLGGF